MVVEFLTDYQPEQQGLKPVRNIIMIARRYINDKFVVDIITLIPFSYFIKI
jgi:hypothetical protein